MKMCYHPQQELGIKTLYALLITGTAVEPLSRPQSLSDLRSHTEIRDTIHGGH